MFQGAKRAWYIAKAAATYANGTGRGMGGTVEGFHTALRQAGWPITPIVDLMMASGTDEHRAGHLFMSMYEFSRQGTESARNEIKAWFDDPSVRRVDQNGIAEWFERQ